jgi:hypothetical protein
VLSAALRVYSNVGLPREFDIACLHSDTDLVLAFVDAFEMPLDTPQAFWAFSPLMLKHKFFFLIIKINQNTEKQVR